MAQRAICFCDGKYIGIETIFTVVNGQQINIPEKLKWLRTKSQNNQLFCPCGCGANLVLVAGDRNLREQHFRLKGGSGENECHFVTEGKTSVDSKIALKCWLDEKLGTDDLETRVPINLIGDADRKYEFSFLARDKKIAVNYCHARANLSDEKFEILNANSKGIQMVYIVDVMNRGNNGQYPEGLMKVQSRQGYCLLLEVEDALYSNAKMYAVFYAQDNDGFWREVRLADGHLSDYTINENGQLLYKNELLSVLLDKSTEDFKKSIQAEKAWHEEEKKRRDEEQKRIQEEIASRKLELQRQQERTEKEQKRQQEEVRRRREKAETKRQVEREHRDEDFERDLEENLSQQHTPVRDAAGNRWLRCEYCGLIAKESEFTSYGGLNHVNLGICRTCSFQKTFEEISKTVTQEVELEPMSVRYDDSVCPDCGGKLQEKRGRYGNFIGCSNYPKCRYTRKTRSRDVQS